MERVVPVLLVTDMGETLAFYQKLGFTLTGCHPSEENATWAEVTRDQAILQFHAERPLGTPEAPTMSGTLYIQTRHVDRLAEEWRGTVVFQWGPEEMDPGGREFGIQDPNGYFLAFMESA